MREFIITPEALQTPEHSTACRCEQCFNAQLDRIIDGRGISWEEVPANDDN